MRKFSMAGAALLALAVLTAPVGTASAEDCGTTGQQWVGTFQGTVYGPYYNRTLEVRVEQGLRVITTKSSNEHPEAIGDLIGGKLHWVTYSVEISPPFGPVAHDDEFTTTSVTCANGKVTAFSGNLHVEHRAYGTSDAPFSVS